MSEKGSRDERELCMYDDIIFFFLLYSLTFLIGGVGNLTEHFSFGHHKRFVWTPQTVIYILSEEASCFASPPHTQLLASSSIKSAETPAYGK